MCVIFFLFLFCPGIYKMAQENISFYEYSDGSYYIVDLYFYDRFFGYEDSYKYYDIDVDKILLYKKVIINMLLDIMM